MGPARDHLPLPTGVTAAYVEARTAVHAAQLVSAAALLLALGGDVDLAAEAQALANRAEQRWISRRPELAAAMADFDSRFRHEA